MANPAGLRSLGLIRESGSTARVLNLALIHQRFGATGEHAAAPLLRVPALNKAMILKHVLRQGERSLFSTPPISTTKIVFPFATQELELGGRSLLFGEKMFERALRGIAGAAHATHVAADIDLLGLLDTLPSFDPFLMRERLRQSGYEPARCYFDMSDADISRMREFVGKEIEQLVGLAYANGGAAARDLSMKLSEKLMTDETAKTLDPLRVALQMSEGEYREGVFCWKGFLYYKWAASRVLPGLPSLARQMLTARVTDADAQTRDQLNAIRKRIVSLLSEAAARVETTLLDYGTAFAGLAQGNPSEFRDFLLRAPSLFMPIGEAIGVIQHIDSYWQFRFPAGKPLTLHIDDALDVYCDFESTLGAMAVVQNAPNTAN